MLVTEAVRSKIPDRVCTNTGLEIIPNNPWSVRIIHHGFRVRLHGFADIFRIEKIGELCTRIANHFLSHERLVAPRPAGIHPALAVEALDRLVDAFGLWEGSHSIVEIDHFRHVVFVHSLKTDDSVLRLRCQMSQAKSVGFASRQS